MTPMRFFAGVVLFLAWPVIYAQAGGKSDTKVKATATAEKLAADGKQKVTITLDIEKNWYLYANPLGGNKYAEDNLSDNKIIISFKAKDKLQADVNYPKGKFKSEVISKDEVAEYHIYQNQVTIAALVRRTAGDGSPLEIMVQVNACLIGKDGKTSTCLPTGVIVVKVP